MKKLLSAPMYRQMATLCGIMLLAVLVAGCQTTSQAVSVSKSTAVCPMCGMATKTVALKDVKYGKCVCPGCKHVTKIDPLLADSLKAYVGDAPSGTVQVCEHCKAVVCECPKCKNKK